MSLRLSISEARARLPELAQRAIASPGELIIIEHRDRKERLVLTAEGHVRMLEAMVAGLRRGGQAGGTFKLAGSLESALSDEELEAGLARSRALRRSAEEEKLRELGEG
jgi:hypothetical protein